MAPKSGESWDKYEYSWRPSTTNEQSAVLFGCKQTAIPLSRPYHLALPYLYKQLDITSTKSQCSGSKSQQFLFTKRNNSPRGNTSEWLEVIPHATSSNPPYKQTDLLQNAGRRDSQQPTVLKLPQYGCDCIISSPLETEDFGCSNQWWHMLHIQLQSLILDMHSYITECWLMINDGINPKYSSQPHNVRLE